MSAIPGLWVDMDHAGGMHTTTDLPSHEKLLGFLQAMPFAWSLLIDTTGGAHGYALFREPWLFDVPEDAARAQTLLRHLQHTVQVWARDHGWHVDAIADLTRVLRPPGTYNHKGGRRGE